LESYKQLQEHYRKLQDFINIASHELKSPVMPIIGYAELLQEDIGERNETRAIIYNANRLNQLAENILDSARIESETLHLRKELFNLKDTISDILHDCNDHLLMRGKSNSIRLIYEPQDIFVRADKFKLSRAISNLMYNAINFTDEGEIKVTAEEIGRDTYGENENGSGNSEMNNYSEQKNMVRVIFKDTGRGISNNILPKLFSKFASSSPSGTGLGLFVCKNIIESHGGTIHAENNSDGKGATFSFLIPNAKDR
jgi:signal transduction histidine kinase